jgi:predicted deacetylase
VSGHWLDPVRAVLDDAAVPRPLFFRDDDAGWDDHRLFLLLDVFRREDVAVDVAVIPAALDRRAARELRARHLDGLLHLHQHGFVHVDHQPDGRKCEFGTARSADEQAGDLARGWAFLSERLRDAVEPVFTPPWNRCEQSTVDALAGLGFSVLSRDHTAAPLNVGAMREVPVTVDWCGRGTAGRWDLHERARRLAASLAGHRTTGVMLHHAVIDDDDRAAVAELVSLVGRHPTAATTHVMSVAA